MGNNDPLHARGIARTQDVSGTGFDVTQHALATLVRENSRALLERWLVAPLRAVDELESRGALASDAAAELRSGLESALELFAVLENEARAVLSPATPPELPR